MNIQNNRSISGPKIIVIGSPFLKFCLVVLALVGATTLLMKEGPMEFGQRNFWDYHGFLFLLFISLFPRLTLLFSSVSFGGVLWFLGFFFAPRLLVAILATISYWQQNPLLVAMAWFVCLSGESSEKIMVHRKMKFTRRDSSSSSESSGSRPEVIDAEFKKI